MNTRSISLWGFVGTLALTTLMAGSQALGLTRMNLPYMLGTMVTPDRDRAKLAGFGMHLINGWLFASLYAAAFQSWRRATWWLGAAIGLVHALFVLVAASTALPALHPRMASEEQGPTPTRQLEPPGFLALNYGYRTPLSVIISHLVYGGILGAFYRLR
jgi:uncharacterized membrane protein YagU involved in acid resistance